MTSINGIRPGDYIVYSNGERMELGRVLKRNRTDDGWFVFYSTGETAANTPDECVRPLRNLTPWITPGSLGGQRARELFNEGDEGGDGLTCPECGNKSHFSTSAVMLYGDVDITTNGWNYTSHACNIDFADDVLLTCRRCGHVFDPTEIDETKVNEGCTK